jgi:hypothetical protein
MLNWATMAGDGNGGYLLERNPFKGQEFESAFVKVELGECTV